MSAPPVEVTSETGDRPRRRRLDAAARRQTILDAAVPLFATAGYEQTRMSDVAARVGVTEPVIFQNFGSKAELFAASLERASEQAVRYLSGLSDEHGNVHDWLCHVLATEHLDQLHAAPMFGVLFADAHRLHFDARVHDALHRSIVLVAEAMADILRRGQTDGSIRSDAPPLALAWLVVSLIQAREFRRTHTPAASAVLERGLLARIVETFSPKATARTAR